MSEDEKQNFDRWDLILSGEGEMTIEKLEEFCDEQINTIEEQFTNPDNSDKKDTYLKACLVVYSALRKAIHAPQAERQALERYLQQLIK